MSGPARTCNLLTLAGCGHRSFVSPEARPVGEHAVQNRSVLSRRQRTGSRFPMTRRYRHSTPWSSPNDAWSRPSLTPFPNSIILRDGRCHNRGRSPARDPIYLAPTRAIRRNEKEGRQFLSTFHIRIGGAVISPDKFLRSTLGIAYLPSGA